jgi:hypothetical protein
MFKFGTVINPPSQKSILFGPAKSGTVLSSRMVIEAVSAQYLPFSKVPDNTSE